jgi:hypothetical protein
MLERSFRDDRAVPRGARNVFQRGPCLGLVLTILLPLFKWTRVRVEDANRNDGKFVRFSASSDSNERGEVGARAQDARLRNGAKGLRIVFARSTKLGTRST